MSFLDQNLSNLEDLKLVPAGETLLTCTRAEKKTSQKGGQYINLCFAVKNEVTAEDIYHILMLPDNSDEKKDHKRMLAIRDACKAMQVNCNRSIQDLINNLDEFVSRECFALVAIENDDAFGDKNIIKSFVVGR